MMPSKRKLLAEQFERVVKAKKETVAKVVVPVAPIDEEKKGPKTKKTVAAPVIVEEAPATPKKSS